MSFTEFAFHPQIQAAIEACGYVSPTPIQKQAMGPVLQGRDLLGLAQTGTGKTAAFVLPTLQRLQKGPRKKVRALIVAPTRELAEQINGEIERMAKGTGLHSVVVYGGVSKNVQAGKLRAGVDIVVACPGRLLDHLNDKTVSLRDIEVLVLDEADHMFDRGFLPDVRRIMRQLPTVRQTLVFSATMPPEIRKLTSDILTDPVVVQINHEKPTETISHACMPVRQAHKTALLKTLLGQEAMTSTLIFTRTKHKAKSLALSLQRSGHNATSLQGNLSQQKRQQALDGFRDGSFTILVATDIAARGIDVSGISHVINYDVPDTVENYTHRTGRTGRAERSGEALTFVTDEDVKLLVAIENYLGKRMTRPQIPAFVVDDTPEIEAPRGPRPVWKSGKRAGSAGNGGARPSAARARKGAPGDKQEQGQGRKGSGQNRPKDFGGKDSLFRDSAGRSPSRRTGSGVSTFGLTSHRQGR